MAEYQEKTVADLRQELRERGIPGTGLTRKQQIIEKLEENDAKKGTEKPSAGTDKKD